MWLPFRPQPKGKKKITRPDPQAVVPQAESPTATPPQPAIPPTATVRHEPDPPAFTAPPQPETRASIQHAQAPDPVQPKTLTPAPVSPGTKRPSLAMKLDDLDHLEDDEPEAPEVELAPQPIDPEAFGTALKYFIENNIGDRRMLGTTLLTAQHSFDINRWVCTVHGEVLRYDLEAARDELVGYLRQQLTNPTLILEVVVDTSIQPPDNPDKPLTAQEKLMAMLDKNPDLGLLIQQFGLQIIY